MTDASVFVAPTYDTIGVGGLLDPTLAWSAPVPVTYPTTETSVAPGFGFG